MKYPAAFSRLKNKLKHLKRPAKAVIVRLADTPLPGIAFLASFVLSRWWLNSDFSYPSEVLMPILLVSLLATLAFYIYRFVFGAGLATHAAALILGYVFYSYRFIHDHALVKKIWGVLPDSYSTEFTQSLVVLVVSIVACGAIGWTAGYIVSRYRFIGSFQPYKILLFAVMFMFAIQLFRFGERYIDIKDELNYKFHSSLLASSPQNPASSKPDIYYLVFDRYASKEILKDNFGYDNSDLMENLKSQGFVNRESANANYPFTMTSIASVMAMQYFPEFEKRFGDSGVWQAASPYREILNNPPIAQLLKNNGYDYNHVSSWWDFTRIGIKADHEPTKSFRLNALGADYYFSDLQRDIMYKSIFSPWLKKGISVGGNTLVKYDLDRHPRENFYAQMDALKAVASRSDKTTPQFSFAHVLVPHPPYVFDENGNYPSYDGERTDIGLDESQKYTNEVTFLNRHIKELTVEILKKSPNSVIVIQSDEGPYPKEFRYELSPDHYYNPLDLKPEKFKQKFGILASYHLPGVSPEKFETMNSPVNIFRFVLNEYLGYGLPMLPDCNLSAGNKFNIFNYELVNETLTGQPAPENCKQYE